MYDYWKDIFNYYYYIFILLFYFYYFFCSFLPYTIYLLKCLLSVDRLFFSFHAYFVGLREAIKRRITFVYLDEEFCVGGFKLTHEKKLTYLLLYMGEPSRTLFHPSHIYIFRLFVYKDAGTLVHRFSFLFILVLYLVPTIYLYIKI